MIAKCIPSNCTIKQSCYRYHIPVTIARICIEVKEDVAISSDCDYFYLTKRFTTED